MFGGFSPEALAGRIEDCKSRFLVTADEGLRGSKRVPLKANVDAALAEPDHDAPVDGILVVKHTGGDVAMVKGRDHWFHEIRSDADCPCEEMNAEDPLFILYTSGSTGKPKGVLHTTGGYGVWTATTFSHVFDYQPGEVFWCTADIGWVTGHSYIVYGPLLNGATEVIFEGVPNALRASLYEFGYVVPQGIRQIKRIAEILEAPNSDLPDLMREECRDMVEQIAEQTNRINARTEKIQALANEADTARRLQTIPGVGPITALAVEAFAPAMENFSCGRDFAAWLGLVPRQFSSGGKERLGRTSKAGQVDIRRLLILGAMSCLNWLGRKSIPEDSWLAGMVARKPRMLVAVALANKMARTIWAMLTKNEDYRVPAQAVAA